MIGKVMPGTNQSRKKLLLIIEYSYFNIIILTLHVLKQMYPRHKEGCFNEERNVIIRW
jgi:hypothetical protein